MRALGAKRLSKRTDESTSMETQDAKIAGYAKLHGHTVAYVAEDLDVSGAVSPFDRPDLGPWLTDPGKIAQWDVLIVAKLDRLSRSLADLLSLVTWLTAHGKVLVSVAESIDLGTAHGRMFVQLLGVFAEFERSRISERRSDAAATLRSQSRWGGGRPPYGYQVTGDKANGYYLAVDEAEQAVIQGMADQVIAGVSVTQVARQLNAAGVASRQGGPWLTGTVLRMLRNPGLRGYMTHDDQVVLNADGEPVTREPVISDDTWARLQAALDGNACRGAGQAVKSPMLVGVATCAACGAPMYAKRKSGRVTHYYQCKTRRLGGSCTSAAVRMADLEAAFEAKLLAGMGADPHRERIDVPAEDHTAELARVDESITQIESLVTSAEMPPASAARMLAKLEAKRAALAALPSRPARVEWRPVGRTVAEHWSALDDDGKRDYLRASHLTVTVLGHPRGSADRIIIGDLIIASTGL